MADQNQGPPPVYQLPDWETPTAKPPKPSFLSRFLPSREATTASSPETSARHQNVTDSGTAKETSGESFTLPMYASAGAGTSSTVNNATNKPTVGASMHSRFDSILPPQRTYFSRSRQFLLLYVLLPLAILIFIVLPLAIGLGVGLSHSSGSKNLPLPGNTDIHTGEITYYDPGLGACGVESDSSEDIVSVSHLVFDAASTGSDPNSNPLCGKKIRVQRDFVEASMGNRSVDVTVVDRCVGCAATDLDLSLSVFTQLAPQDTGRAVGRWAWLD